MKKITKKLPCFLLLWVVMGVTTSLANTARYRLTLRSDPATSIVIGWDQISGSSPRVYYGTNDYGTNWSAYPNSKSPSRVVNSKGMNNHFARLTGLQPNRAYYFVIRDSQGTSQRFWFKTAPSSSSQRLSFIAGGDSRNNRTPRINANKLVSKLRPHAVFFGGDMTSSDTNSQWITWFNDWQYTIGSDGRMIPIVAARGNHEGSNSSIYNLFDTPSSNVYYALTFGGNLIRSYTLNTETSISGNQTTWLNNDLATNSGVKWKMAQYHKPMRPHVSSKSEGNNQYNYWSQPFYNNNVKLVVESDAHTVKTTWPVRPSLGSGSDEGFIRDNNKGTVYVGEGCWGAPLRTNNDNKNWTRNSSRFNQFKWIFVDQNKIEVRTVKVDNANSVGTVNDNNIFSSPSNLDLWRPSNGSVVTILPSTTDSGGGGSTTIISKRVSSSYDDAEQAVSGKMYHTSSDLELVYDSYQSAGNQRVGMRFRSLSIPRGVTITNAYIQFTVDETSSTTTNLTIRGHDTDDSRSFGSGNNDISNRALTSARVNWSPPSWTSVGQAGSAQRTPNIKEVIQEIVDRSGWSAGNDLSILINGTGKRTAESYNGSRSRAPLLVVEYSSGSSFARFAGQVVDKVSSTLKVAEINQFRLYPNPVNDLLNIDLSFLPLGSDVHLLIHSITGSVVYDQRFRSGAVKTINTKDFEVGIYIVDVQAEGKSYNRRLIKN